MQFLRSKFWLLAVILAVFGQFSPLAARFCTMTQSSTLCVEMASASPASSQSNKTAQAMPCGHCCKQSEALVALLHSAPLLSNPRYELSLPAFEAPLATLPVTFVVEQPPCEVKAIYHEIDLPPPPERTGSPFSCRAPPVEV